MAILARLWFHFCSASGWVLAERTGLRAKAAGSCCLPGQLSFKQHRRSREDWRISSKDSVWP